ncbi:hypothetical protein H9Y04_06710 [Streptomyces sp. TRM66268-LWL]|uniref:Uncharacterized protein n=1 Tax=Streptomyces polyasparticus TaxID=2767826 RepID=A0ABR7SA12_9ACTN|nr:hypothetical protein [Streptomyces polyasparticus]MBC9712263.1 hypothetical protein [Streptomyces polyasparticus]
MTTSSGPEREALERVLAPHFRTPGARPEIGPGWVGLVARCHQAVVAEFPGYQLNAVKQKLGRLAYQALPGSWQPGGNWSRAEHHRIDEITDAFEELSASVCERCGNAASLRETRRILLALCDACEAVVPADGRL